MHHRMLCRGLIIGLVSWSAACVDPPTNPGLITGPRDMSKSDLSTMDDMDMSKVVADDGAVDGGGDTHDMSPDATSTCVCGAPGCLELECTPCNDTNECGDLLCDPVGKACVTCLIEEGETIGCSESAPECLNGECIECEDNEHFSELLDQCVVCLIDNHCVSINAPHCNEIGECSMCDDSNPEEPNDACLSVDTTKPYCSDGMCIACVQSSDCTDIGMPTCDKDTNTCVACTDNGTMMETNADCEMASAGEEPVLTQCVAQECVECSTDTHCPGPGAELAGRRCINNECDDVAPQSIVVGLPCEYDLACELNAACVPLNYDGNDIGSYCLFEESKVTQCPTPWSVRLFKPSESNSTSRKFCGFREDITSPEAILNKGTSCIVTNLDECGIGGVCTDNTNVGDFRCTYPCRDVGRTDNPKQCTDICSIASGTDSYCL